MELISTKNLSIGYDSKIVAKGINFNIINGDYLHIVGLNGSGKSTFIKTLLGLIPSIEGKIKYGGGLTPKMIGYLPQKIEVDTTFPASVYEVVLSGCLNRLKGLPFYTKKHREIAKRNMDLLEIEFLKHKSFKELSGGQQQRVLIARSLCATDKVLILDEPFNALDAMMTKALHKLINRINRELGVTIIIVSHDINGTINYANKILCLDENKTKCLLKEDFINSEIAKKYIGDNYDR